ncbi:SGNH/GDSL hydrolase family protein [Massilia forsythiae]|uniref:SGNH/GDSL hydrolase family protein n=1 Tax=Massilia forsythiae TaxID=2728020 RepID=A0A7Z2VXD2_9BURK|nr:SGNH/GDSL hydrolase family protein [Massilia forsythiae]QJE01201.1 SGNH/GDSL hydrolase family protein [Massilia forsythiae]
MKPILRSISGLRQLLAPQAGVLQRRRRALVAAVTLAVAGLSLSLPPSPAMAQARPWDGEQWVGTWGTAPAGPPLAAQLQTFSNQTLRMIVHTSIGGAQVRIRISNEFGTMPLRIGEAHVALRQGGAAIVAGSDRPLTFGGARSVTIPPGAPVLSDPVQLDVPALSDLAVSLYLPETVQANTLHGAAFQTNYVSLPGNFTGAATLPTDRTITSWPFLTEVDVDAPGSAAIVALGDSITDGAVTTVDANRRWPDLLALRLQTTRDLVAASTGQAGGAAGGAGLAANARLGVINRGIGGNRLLRDPGEQPLFGRAALARFDRDVLATAGVRYMVVLIGINDIGHPGTGTIPASEAPTVSDLIAGYRQLIERAHAKGIAAYGATLTPFEGTVFPGYYSPEKEQIRQAVNDWIRSGDAFDGVIDFERAVRDPSHPARMLPAYDSGDHLHPNDLGMQAMANAIPLELFRGLGSAARAATSASALAVPNGTRAANPADAGRATRAARTAKAAKPAAGAR